MNFQGILKVIIIYQDFSMESLKISELDDKLNKDNKILRHLITSIKSTDSLIAADKMDEVPE